MVFEPPATDLLWCLSPEIETGVLQFVVEGQAGRGESVVAGGDSVWRSWLGMDSLVDGVGRSGDELSDAELIELLHWMFEDLVSEEP